MMMRVAAAAVGGEMEKGYERKRNGTYGGVGGVLYIGRQHSSFSIVAPLFLLAIPLRNQ